LLLTWLSIHFRRSGSMLMGIFAFGIRTAGTDFVL
jgi:hypothetical protein